MRVGNERSSAQSSRRSRSSASEGRDTNFTRRKTETEDQYAHRKLAHQVAGLEERAQINWRA